MSDVELIVGEGDTINLSVDEDTIDLGPEYASTPDKNYTQAFTNSASVVVAHNLSKYPATQIFDSAGDQVEGTITHNSLDQLTATFTASFTGTITCN